MCRNWVDSLGRFWDGSRPCWISAMLDTPRTWHPSCVNGGTSILCQWWWRQWWTSDVTSILCQWRWRQWWAPDVTSCVNGGDVNGGQWRDVNGGQWRGHLLSMVGYDVNGGLYCVNGGAWPSFVNGGVWPGGMGYPLEIIYYWYNNNKGNVELLETFQNIGY